MSLRLHVAALSDLGRVRRDNQDSGYAGEHLLVIADGVGGAARGDIASSLAVEQLRTIDVPPEGEPIEIVAGAIHRAHRRIAEVVEQHPELEGTSTTAVAALFDGRRLGFGHVGDSRAYLLRDGSISQLTTDHTFVQSLIEEGRITEEEARVHPHRSLILRAVDGVREPEPDSFYLEVVAGDRILLCSDGASSVLGNDVLAQLLGTGTPAEASAALITASLDAGSSDNITVVVAEVLDGPADGPVDGPVDGTAAGESGEAPPDEAAYVVGAAALAPVTKLGKPSRGLLRGLRGDTGELEPVPGNADDPEAARYAPRPPRRFLWLRRIGIIALVIAVIVALGTAAYAWTQTQYYVAPAGNRVAIYKGIEADIPGLRMHHVAATTGLRLDRLPASYARQVREGISADSSGDARAIVTRLRGLAVCPAPSTGTPTASATASPTATPSKRPTKKPTRGSTKRPTQKATHKPSGTPTTSAASPTGTPTSAGSRCGGRS